MPEFGVRGQPAMEKGTREAEKAVGAVVPQTALPQSLETSKDAIKG